MDIASLILYLAAAIVFALAALNTPTVRVNLVPLGLLLWVLVPLIHAIDGLQ